MSHEAIYTIRLPKGELSCNPLICKIKNGDLYFALFQRPDSKWNVFPEHFLQDIYKSFAPPSDPLTLDELLLTLTEHPILQSRVLSIEL